MQVTLRQIIHCPYQGITKRLYLESKALELIVLTLEPILNTCQQKVQHSAHAIAIKSILPENSCWNSWKNRRSLKELTQALGCNEYKLKQGFRELFGTTVFACLHNYRMECAQLLLMEEQNTTITEVACAVGYTNLSAFCSAFWKKFGISPKTYWQNCVPQS